MKTKTFLKLRVGFMLMVFLWLLAGTAAIPLLTLAAFQNATNLLELMFFPLFAIGFGCCAIGTVLLAPLIRDDLRSLLGLTSD